MLASITVTTTADDITPNDGSVSLREAITAINAGNELGDADITAQTPGTFGTADTINFNIPGTGVHTIMVGSDPSATGLDLPVIIKPVLIDGTTQYGFDSTTHVPIIQLDGTDDVAAGIGIELGTGSGGSVLRGLIISHFNAGGAGVGIFINSSNGNTIAGNYIGTDPLGTSAEGNTDGIQNSGANNTIGGTSAGTRNVISGNTKIGIFASDAEVIQGNYIGTDASGTLGLGNGGAGVEANGAGDMIGGTLSSEGNIIAFNGGAGVAVFFSANLFFTGTENVIRHNSIFSNKGLGIDLGIDGVTPNDPGDGDTGANHLQNFPVLASAITSGGSTTITGEINTNANTALLVDVYANAEPDPSGFGQGQTFLGTIPVVTDSSGNATFTGTFPVTLTIGETVSATATTTGIAPFGDTSEFSQDIDATVIGDPPLTATAAASLPAVEGTSFTTTVAKFADPDTRSQATDFTASISWGDTVTSAGTVVADPAGGFDVNGKHKYIEEGQYPVFITITDTKGRNDTGGIVVNASTNAEVSDPAVVASPAISTFHSTKGSSTGTLKLATFVDPGGPEATGDYSATIDWNDGSNPDNLGTVSYANGVFTLSGNHVYTATGTFNPTVVIHHDDITVPDSNQVQDTVDVAAPAPSLKATGATITGNEGRLASGTVANFISDDLTATKSRFSATVNWADGSTTAGTIVPDAAGHFHVTASHTYAEANTSGYAVKVTIHQTGGSTVVASSVAKIAESPLDTPSNLALTAKSGVAFTNVALGTFRDQDAVNINAGDYNATIDWNDGTKSSATFAFKSAITNNGSFWTLKGSHKYTTRKAYTVTITVTDNSSTVVVKAMIKVS